MTHKWIVLVHEYSMIKSIKIWNEKNYYLSQFGGDPYIYCIRTVYEFPEIN